LVSGIFESEFLTHGIGLHPQRFFHVPAADLVFALAQIATLGLLVLGGVCLVLRLRRSRGVERQQLKWFVYTVALVTCAIPVLALGFDVTWGYLLFPLFPIAAGIAILQHQLFDIDVVIRRTLIYGALTATLGAAYLCSVLLLQLLLLPSSD